MKLTDSLRAFCAQTFNTNTTRAMELRAIADSIDAEAAGMQAFCDHLHEAAKNRQEVTICGVDYVALPVDADGVPILVDDKIEICGKPYRVWNLWLDSDKKWFLNCDEGDWEGDEIATLRHYHPPTVEDVLREFALRAIRESEGNYGDLDETCAEYAAKLRIAGENE
ncbi:MAG: hypothetical protein IJG82_09380 [Atopobiaceae bacterium]|nr:hypothetical protein [Atopobiaceae bacterium]